MYLGAIASLFVAFGFHCSAFVLIIAICALSFFYIVPLLFANGKNLRDIPHLKAYLIALVWTMASVVLPAMESDTFFSGRTFQLTASNFLFILALTIPFDIRDIHLDEKSKWTIPQFLGLNGSKLISLVLISASVFIGANDLILITHLSISILTYLILLALTTTKRQELFFSFLIDGMLVLHPLLIIFSKSFG